MSNDAPTLLNFYIVTNVKEHIGDVVLYCVMQEHKRYIMGGLSGIDASIYLGKLLGFDIILNIKRNDQ